MKQMEDLEIFVEDSVEMGHNPSEDSALQKVISSKMTEHEYGQLADFRDTPPPPRKGMVTCKGNLANTFHGMFQ